MSACLLGGLRERYKVYFACGSIVVCGADKNLCSWFENNISEKFETTKISDLKWF